MSSYYQYQVSPTMNAWTAQWLVRLLLFLIIASTPRSVAPQTTLNGERQQSDDITNIDTPTLYGTEVSWPMQVSAQDTAEKSANTLLYGSTYLKFMKGCYHSYSKEQCASAEADRIRANAWQPSRVPRNYTAAGYAKVVAPAGAWTILRQFWETYSEDQLHGAIESWDVGNIYTNHWESPTRILNVHPVTNATASTGDQSTPLSSSEPRARRTSSMAPPHLSLAQRRTIVEQVQSVLERWTGVPLLPTSMYGIRSYSSGSILAPHIDRCVLTLAARWFLFTVDC
jgi:prolyl 4-hydroxylase